MNITYKIIQNKSRRLNLLFLPFSKAKGLFYKAQTLGLHSSTQVPCNSQEQLKQLAMPHLLQKAQTPGKKSMGKLYNTEPLAQDTF